MTYSGVRLSQILVCFILPFFASNHIRAATPGEKPFRDQLEFRILTLSSQSSGHSNIIEVLEDDILPSGAKFRIEIRPKYDLRLRIQATSIDRSSKRNSVKIILDDALQSGVIKTLPSKFAWFELDDASGTENFMIEVDRSGKISRSERSFQHVAKSYMESSFDDQRTERGNKFEPDENSKGFSNIRGFARGRSNSILKSELDEFRVALVKMSPQNSEPITRGAKGVQLFKSSAHGVVFINSGKGIGSGSIISKDGTVLTNWHVVRNRKIVGVIFKSPSGTSIKPSNLYPAEVVRVDQESDLALLKVKSPPANLRSLELGNVSDIQIGADVHAIGHPVGQSWSYTTGIISQLRTNFTWGSDPAHRANIIQTQTPLNPGNSGGPLLTDSGKIIGVNSFIKKGADGLNFAVHLDAIQTFLDKKRPATRSKKPGNKCKVVYGKPRPGKKNKTVVVPMDTNCNGKVDALAVDTNGDSKPDYLLLDKDEDGKVDVRVQDHPSGKGEVHVYFGDRGGIKLIGYDFDRDGNVDRFSLPPHQG